jgi:N-acetylglucosamine kinase
MNTSDKQIFVLGLDGGGSHTQCVILDQNGSEIGRGVGGASNHQSVGADAAKRAIAEAMEKALHAAGNPTISAACWGMAGLDRPEDEIIIQQIAEQLMPQIQVKVVHDSTIALAGGTGGKQFGVVIISGTGSIVVGYHPSGRIERASGWGHLLGDEGSGYYIALGGLNAATRAFDGRDSETSLVEDFVGETAETSFENLVSRIYLDNWSAPEIAALAPVVLAAADRDDVIAVNIVDRAAQELALAARVVIQKLGMEGDVFDVVLSGGIFIGSTRMFTGTKDRISSFAPKMTATLPIKEPLIGAGMIALQSLHS